MDSSKSGFESNAESSERSIDRAATTSFSALSKWALWPFSSGKRFMQFMTVFAFVAGSVVGVVLVMSRNAQNRSAASGLPLPPPPPPPPTSIYTPVAPTGLSAVPVSTSEIDLSWAANTDMEIVKYVVYRDGKNVAEVSSGTSYADKSLSANTSYAYTVSAAGTLGLESAQSSEVSVKTLDVVSENDTTPPSVPTNLSGSTISATEISLSWTASTDDVGVMGYKIYRCSGRKCVPTTEISTSSTAAFSDAGLSPKTSYSYRVKAMDAAGNESGFSSTASASTSNAGGKSR
ncbi:MAG: fibronectin type III domain-containing protein [Candidatus Moraniibacteriota bacterium]|nr:MAG: fibronectin type III domain-containing protein [Candidatus Moranbacteria bacterium]